MTDQSGAGPTIILVQPTGLKPGEDNQYTDIGLTGLLNTHAGQINSQRQVMWQRYGYSLVANAIFLPLITRPEVPLLFQLVGALFGIIICWVGYTTLQEDRRVLISRIRFASTFRWQNLPQNANVFILALTPEEFNRGVRVYRRAGFILLLFMFLYPGIYVYLAWPMIKPLVLRMGLLNF